MKKSKDNKTRKKSSSIWPSSIPGHLLPRLHTPLWAYRFALSPTSKGPSILTYLTRILHMSSTSNHPLPSLLLLRSAHKTQTHENSSSSQCLQRSWLFFSLLLNPSVLCLLHHQWVSSAALRLPLRLPINASPTLIVNHQFGRYKSEFEEIMEATEEEESDILEASN